MRLVSLFITCCISAFSHAQINSKDVLFTVDNEPIKAKEFIRVYNKNLDLVKDESQKDIDGYLKLFVNYQLKVKEAKRLGLDKDATYQREFTNYKNQLIKNYLSDSKVTDELVQEAYQRMGSDVKASHILIRIDENEKDTLKVYNDLIDLRNRVLNEGYEKVKAEVHNGNTIFAENLGYFSAFKMVYEFENAAFNTKVGEVSMPFRTRFGYHIVSVEDKRPSRGEVTVAHIMVANNTTDSLANPETRINEIYKKLNQGENFESLAKQFSDDKSSAANGGLLNAFSSGQLSSQEFEDAAFALSEPNSISKPIKSAYGWHIIKLISKKGLPTFEEMKPEIENKVKRDSRSTLINTSMVNNLKKKYKITENKEVANYFESILTSDFFKRTWTLPTDFEKDKTVFKIQDQIITYDDFGTHLLTQQKLYSGKTTPFSTLVEKELNTFQESKILKYQEDNLEFENEDFAAILGEYRDGLLLFDLMDKQVWNKAVTDTIGLQQFYDKNKSNYTWQDRVDVVIATAAKKSDISKVEEALKKGKTQEEISAMLNTEASQNVIFSKGLMETDNPSLPKDLELKKGVSKVYNYNDAFHVIIINDIMPKGNKSFEEAKGKVISDYQNSIEEQWLGVLNKQYKVNIDDKVLQKVKQQLN
uniref:peptidylprolyl isomerase n=1 Tax=Gelidibacter sp. TaxID=2018083 RepID=UPI00404A6EB8